MNTLKDVRMWHWRKFLHHRKLQRQCEKGGHKTQAAYNRRDANLHLGAVQALNDVLPGTAEQDCNEFDAAVKV